MLHLRIDLQNIHYEETLAHFYPMISELPNKMLSDAKNQQPGMRLLARLLKRLAPDARDGAMQMLKEMSPEEKDQLLCAMANLYEKQLRSKLQQLLNQKGWGCVKLGTICLEADANHVVHIRVHNLQIDYNQLLQKSELKGRLPAFAKLLPAAMISALEEGLVLNLKLQSAIREAAGKLLAKSGIQADLDRLAVLPERYAQSESRVKLTPELEDMMYHTVVRLAGCVSATAEQKEASQVKTAA